MGADLPMQGTYVQKIVFMETLISSGADLPTQYIPMHWDQMLLLGASFCLLQQRLILTTC